MSDSDSHVNFDLAIVVSRFMMYELQKIDPVRFEKATANAIPHGDIAYSNALKHWIEGGCKKNSWFSYAPGQIECELLIEFKKEISEKFGLEILSIKDGEERRLSETKVKTIKVVDWNIN